MSENIESLNKQIASFVLLSAALAVPTISSSANAMNNNIIADASVMVVPVSAASSDVEVATIQKPMMFYGSPSVPQINDNTAIIQKPMMFYGSPSVPQINDDTAIIQKPMMFYGSPSIPETPVINSQAPMVFYGAPEIPVNIIDQQVVPTPQLINEQTQSIQQNYNINQSQTNGSNAAAQIPTAKLNNVNMNANMKTEGFVFSEYGNVKIVEPFAHFIFK